MIFPLDDRVAPVGKSCIVVRSYGSYLQHPHSSERSKLIPGDGNGKVTLPLCILFMALLLPSQPSTTRSFNLVDMLSMGVNRTQRDFQPSLSGARGCHRLVTED